MKVYDRPSSNFEKNGNGKRGSDEIIVENENMPKIITIASGKGGVGKSNLATNLSICLTKLDKKFLY